MDILVWLTLVAPNYCAKLTHWRRSEPLPTTLFGDNVQRLLDSIPHLLWICAPTGECTHLSPQWVRYTGIPEGSQLGYGWLEQLHPGDRDRVNAEWARASEARALFDTEFRIRRHDGEYRWFKTRATPEFDSNGRVVAWYGTNTDVQDLRDAKDRLAQANAELESRVAARTREIEDAHAQLAIAQRLAHVGSWTFTPASGEVDWSDELFRIVGLPIERGAPNYHHQQQMFRPDSWERLTRAIAQSVETGQGYELELDVIRPDGEIRHAIARATAIRDADGAVRQLVGTFHDVTELLRARRENAIANERLGLATVAAGMGVWDWNIQEDRIVWDAQMFALYGQNWSESAVTYEVWRDAVHPEDRENAERAVQAAVDVSLMFDTEFRVRGADGRLRHLRGKATVFRDVSGKPLRMVGVNWDVSRERHTEAHLRSSRALLDQFATHAPAAIAMLDMEMRYLKVSEQWVRDYGLASRDLIGRCHYDVFPDLPERWKEIHRRVLAGSIEACAEDPYPRADGSTDWLQWEARPWHDGEGAIGGLIFFTQVITARKTLEAELLARTGELERSNHDLEMFAYAASHDLQEPLRAVSGCAQLLARGYGAKLDAPGHELIGHIVDGAERMRTLITDLLAYSRIASHGAPPVPVELRTTVDRALANLASSIAEADATVEVGPLPQVPVDATQLAQVFQNLIGNAIKYRGDHAVRVRVFSARADEAWLIGVEDNGIGIEARYLERVFGIFQRLHTRTEYPGTGIGLALCKKIVQRHGGRIWAESRPAVGSTFFFILPAGEGPQR